MVCENCRYSLTSQSLFYTFYLNLMIFFLKATFLNLKIMGVKQKVYLKETVKGVAQLSSLK